MAIDARETFPWFEGLSIVLTLSPHGHLMAGIFSFSLEMLSERTPESFSKEQTLRLREIDALASALGAAPTWWKPPWRLEVFEGVPYPSEGAVHWLLGHALSTPPRQGTYPEIRSFLWPHKVCGEVLDRLKEHKSHLLPQSQSFLESLLNACAVRDSTCGRVCVGSGEAECFTRFSVGLLKDYKQLRFPPLKTWQQKKESLYKKFVDILSVDGAFCEAKHFLSHREIPLTLPLITERKDTHWSVIPALSADSFEELTTIVHGELLKTVCAVEAWGRWPSVCSFLWALLLLGKSGECPGAEGRAQALARREHSVLDFFFHRLPERVYASSQCVIAVDEARGGPGGNDENTASVTLSLGARSIAPENLGTVFLLRDSHEWWLRLNARESAWLLNDIFRGMCAFPEHFLNLQTINSGSVDCLLSTAQRDFSSPVRHRPTHSWYEGSLLLRERLAFVSGTLWSDLAEGKAWGPQGAQGIDFFVTPFRGGKKVLVESRAVQQEPSQFEKALAETLARLRMLGGKGVVKGLGRLRLADMKASLRFRAEVVFRVGDVIYHEAQWREAKKLIHGDWQLPDGTVIDGKDYQRATEEYMFRERAFARYKSFVPGKDSPNEAGFERGSRVSIAEFLGSVWILQRETLRQIDAVLPDALTGALSELLTHGQTPLYEYQKYGVAWALLRLELGLGVCIADDMGLGKTLQALAIIEVLRMEKPDLSVLIITPKSTLSVWMSQCKIHFPQLSLAIFDGGPYQNTTCTVCTYARMRLAGEEILHRTYDLVVLDEAHAVKNVDTATARAVRQLHTHRRLALTGTPIENHAHELWSLFEWLNPGSLGSMRAFDDYIKRSRISEEKSSLLAPVRAALAPVMLRRLKSDVQKMLPHVLVFLESRDPTFEQRVMYRAVMDAALDSFYHEDHGAMAHCLKALTHLKQICNHPECYQENPDEPISDLPGAWSESRWRDIISRGPKLQWLQILLEKLEGDRGGMVIFTQYRKAAELLQSFFENLGYPRPDFFDGTLNIDERSKMLHVFRERCRLRQLGEPVCYPVLVASLKAGGVGIDLSAADRVVHFDRWWNPAVEDQANSRVHRAGQERIVCIHYFTTRYTIEESMATLLQEKRNLESDLIGTMGQAGAGFARDRESFLHLVDPQRYFRSSSKS